MTLRIRLALALGSLAAAAVLIFGVVSYRTTASDLNKEIDHSLRDAAEGLIRTGADVDQIDPGALRSLPGFEGRRSGGFSSRDLERILVQFVAADGSIVCCSRFDQLPVDDDIRSLAADGERSRSVGIWRLDDERFRSLTVGLRGGGAVQLARSLDETDRLLDAILRRMLVTTALLTLAGALVGWLIARRVTRPLVALTNTAEHIAATGELAVMPEAGGTDEVGRLGEAFGAMVGSLARSRESQQRLVQDAGHELRTPLTSLRTNVALLHQLDRLPLHDQEQLIADLDSESRELTNLVNELVTLATAGDTTEQFALVDLGTLADRVRHRAQRRFGRTVNLTVSNGETIAGPPAGIERAVSNLVENAIKFSTDGPIDIAIVGTLLSVRDHGPGIATGDLNHIFDRFYRSDSARATSGSGLGLSIVADVMQRCGGRATASNHPEGGAVLTLSFPSATSAAAHPFGSAGVI